METKDMPTIITPTVAEPVKGENLDPVGGSTEQPSKMSFPHEEDSQKEGRADQVMPDGPDKFLEDANEIAGVDKDRREEGPDVRTNWPFSNN